MTVHTYREGHAFRAHTWPGPRGDARDSRRANLRAARGFLRLLPTEPELPLVHRGLDSWEASASSPWASSGRGNNNPRLVIANLTAASRAVSELYCQRGDVENRLDSGNCISASRWIAAAGSSVLILRGG